MIIPDGVLSNEEQVIFALRRLYGRYGYIPFKMSKFEEYDLYMQNKSFLVSDNILTFTDTTGKLMALKPDVTLSIVRASKDGETSKVFYNEKVYRPGKYDRSFKEITQVGLEYIGQTDDYAICEVLTLALESLIAVSPDCTLDISHLELLFAILDEATEDPALKDKLLGCISRKNPHDLLALCRENGVGRELAEKLALLCQTEGSPKEVFKKLDGVFSTERSKQTLARFQKILAPIEDKRLHIDFSVVNDRYFYSGIVFKGFAKGVPDSVLSGGQYDRLMQKMGKRSSAIGFAVYLDELERLYRNDKPQGVDAYVLYDDETDEKTICRLMKDLTADGKNASALKKLPKDALPQAVIDLRKGGGA